MSHFYTASFIVSVFVRYLYIPSGPAKGHVLTTEMYDIMLGEYYDQRGWDQNGVPDLETVEKLGLSELVNLQ
ncbi:MAG TPA: aldehyde ferredoxin oxidoreductase C-terminal domain-containing protein [Desulfobacterales bacterium]|nr:aldehyde ferredoxin oxidoreductase C-terminal domain-containing protein [Desulfobacterales bacterium]